MAILGVIIIGAILFCVIEYKQFHQLLEILIETAIVVKTEKGEFNDDEDDSSDKEEEEMNDKNDREGKKEEFDDLNNKNEKNDNTQIKEKSLNEKNDKVSEDKNIKEDILQIKDNKLFSVVGDKSSIINLQNNKLDLIPKEKNENIQNMISIDNNKTAFGKSNEVNDNSNDLIVNAKRKEEYMQKTDSELNNLDYEDAKNEDKRTFFQYYFSLIKTKHIIFFPIRGKKDFNSRIINICFVLFLFPFYLTINTMFVNESVIHNIYLSEGIFDFSYNVSKIILASFVLYVLQVLLSYLISVERIALKIKGKDNKNFFKKVTQIINIITLKFFLFFAIIILLLLLSWIYMACFTALFPKSKLHLIKITGISISISLVIPLVLYLLPSVLRIQSLKGEGGKREKLYNISIYLQMI